MKGRSLGFCILFLFGMWASLSAQTSTTVYGTDTYPADHMAVQAAVDAFNIVELDGVFDFGPDGWIWITMPDVTLVGSTNGALIKGGDWPIYAEPFGGNTPSNLTIRNLTLDSPIGIGITVSFVEAAGNLTIIEGNTVINASNQGIHWCNNFGSAEINNNVVDGTIYGIYTHDDGTGAADEYIEITGNTVTALATLTSLRDNCPRTIADNDLTATLAWAVAIQSGSLADRFTQLDPDGMPPTLVQNNSFTMVDCTQPAFYLGNAAFGAVNCVVRDNVFSGYTLAGISVGPRGGWNTVINNDLSGLTTYDGQVWESARHDVFSGNVFGPIDGWITAIDIFSWGHPVMPEPTAFNTFMDNDYRMTGLPGWDNGAGVFILGFDWWYGSYELNEVRDNLIFASGRFPIGEGGAHFQVMDLGIDNRVIGLPANGLTDPGIGQDIKEARQQVLESVMEAEEMLEALALEKIKK